jgi:hypothetical protein
MICAKDGCTAESVGKSKYCRPHRDEARQAWLGKIKASGAERNARNAKWAKIHAEAHEAGMRAANEAKPVPMVVEQHANQLDDSSPVVQRWVVEGGPCGFAWVVVRPGNCSFALWAKKHARADKHYYGGVSIWCPLNTQSMAIKEAYCRAYANILKFYGINAHMGSRLD